MSTSDEGKKVQDSPEAQVLKLEIRLAETQAQKVKVRWQALVRLAFLAALCFIIMNMIQCEMANY